jgi:hypothetical protein
MAKYKVVGPNSIDGHGPGSVFEADLTPEREAAMIDGGHLERARANTKETAVGEPVTPARAAVEADQRNPAVAQPVADTNDTPGIADTGLDQNAAQDAATNTADETAGKE